MRKNNKLKFLKLIILAIILFFSNSCNNKNSRDNFFLGGEIINPSSNYVNFYYNNIKIDFKDRAKNLNKPLYQCPSCLKEHVMDSDKDKIWCTSCNKTYKMDVYGQLKAIEGKTEFAHIPDWFEFQRANVRKQIEDGTYHFEDDVTIESLPNTDGYIPLGRGTLKHDINGFVLESSELEEKHILNKEPLSMNGLHIEYDYFGKGDCVSFSTLNDTFYIYPENQNYSVTKFHLAVEELYKLEVEKKS